MSTKAIKIKEFTLGEIISADEGDWYKKQVGTIYLMCNHSTNEELYVVRFPRRVRLSVHYSDVKIKGGLVVKEES